MKLDNYLVVKLRKGIAVLPHPVSEPLADLIAGRFRALSEPTRIRLLDALRDEPASVQALAAAVGTSPQNVSKHLTILVDSGIVSRHRQGTSSIHEIVDDSVFAMCEQVCGAVSERYAELARISSQATPGRKD